MLTIRFYNFWGKSDVINKKAGTYATLEATRANIAPDMPFDFLHNVQITLNEYINTNYMWVTADDEPHEWYYTVNVTKNSDQQYVYQGFIDAAATAFYNGCMDDAVCKKIYSATDYFLPDPRVTYEPYLYRNIFAFDPTPYGGNTWYAINVVSKIAPQTGSTITSGGNITSFVVNSAALNSIISGIVSWPLADRQRFWNSVVSISPLRLLPQIFSLDGLTKVSAIQLAAVCDPADLTDDAGSYYKLLNVPTGAIYMVTGAMPSTEIVCLARADEKSPIRINEPIDLSSPITISLSNLINLSFTPTQITGMREINTISVKLIYDTLGGTYMAYPVINDFTFPELVTSAVNTEVSAVLRPDFTNQLLTASAYVAGAVGSATSIASGILTGNAAGVVGGLTSLAGTAAQVISDQTGASKVGTPLTSGYGGSPLAVPNLSSYICWYSHIRVTSTDFNSMFGYPCERYTTVHSIGYSQVSEVYLDSKGLPDAVIQAAIQTLKSGYRITD